MNDKIAHDESSYGVLMEKLIDQVQMVLENIGDMNKLVSRIPFIEIKLKEHDTRFETIEKAVTDLSGEVKQLDKTVKGLCVEVKQLVKTVGNVEHKVEFVTTLALTPYKKHEILSEGLQN